MKITKYGHCCMLLEEGGVRILTDPSDFTADVYSHLTDIGIILYTHEHGDHYHLESLKTILALNPNAQIVCNEAVSQLLELEGIAHTKITDGVYAHEGLSIEGISAAHAEVHRTIPRIQNTGYFIGERLWYPGDAFHTPHRTPEILALPIAGPWMKLADAIEYAIALKPKIAFPIHDWVLSDMGQSVHNRVAGNVLGENGINFSVLELKKGYEF